MKYGKRLLALVLVFGMVVTMLPENTYAEIAFEATQTTEVESTGTEAGSTELSTEATTETEKASTEATTETEKASTEATTETEQASTEVATETEKASTEATTETEKASTEATTEQPTTAGLTSGGVTATYQEIALGEEQTVYGNGRDNKFLYTPEETGWYRMDTVGSEYQNLTLYAYDVSTGLANQEGITYGDSNIGTRALFMYLEADKHYVMSYYSYSSMRSVITLNKLQTITGISIDTQPSKVNELAESYSTYDLSGTQVKVTYADGTYDVFENKSSSELDFAGLSASVLFRYGSESGLTWNTAISKLLSDIKAGTTTTTGTISASATLYQTDLCANPITGLQLSYNYVTTVALTNAELVTVPTRTEYYQNSSMNLDFSGMVIRLTYADGHTIDLSKPGSCSTGQYRYSYTSFSAFDTSVVGTQTITINCDSDSSKNVTFPISVLENPYDSMRILTEPNQTTYCDYYNGGADYTGLSFELYNSKDSSVPTKTISYSASQGMSDDTYGGYKVSYDGNNNFSYLAASKDPYTATVSMMGLTATYKIYVKSMADLAAEGGELTQEQPVTYVADAKGNDYQTYYSFQAFGTAGEKTDYKFAMSTDTGASLNNTYLNIYSYDADTAQYTTVYSKYAESNQVVELTAGKTYYIGLWSYGSKGHTYTLSASLQPELDKFEITSKRTQFLDGLEDIDYSDILSNLQVKLTYGDTTETCMLGNISYTASLQDDGTEKLVFGNGFTLTYDGDHSQYLTPGSYQVALSYGTMSETYTITVQDVKTAAEQLTLDTPTIMTATGNSNEIHPYSFTPAETGYYKLAKTATAGNLDFGNNMGQIYLYNSKLLQLLSGFSSMTVKLEAGQTYYFGITSYGSTGSTCTFILQKQTELQSIKATYGNGVVIPELSGSDLNSIANSVVVSYTDDQGSTKSFVGGFNGGQYNADGSATYISYYGVQLTFPKTSYTAEGTSSVKVSCLGAETTCDINVISLKNYLNPLTLNTPKSLPNGYNGTEYDTFIPDETGYYQLKRTGSCSYLRVYDESATTVSSGYAANVVVRLEQGKKYIIQNAYYQTSSENTIALLKIAAASIDKTGVTDNFTQQMQQDYYSFTPQQSGYYILNESVTSGAASENDEWYRTVGTTLYDDKFQNQTSTFNSFRGSQNTKFSCGYLESGKTYYLGVDSMYSTGGSITLTLEKQGTVQSISASTDTVKAVAGISFGNLVKKLSFNVSYSDGSPSETLDMNNIVKSGTTYDEDKVYSYAINDAGVTVQLNGDEDDGMSKGTYTLTATCQGVSCTVTAQIVSPAEAAEEITDTINVTSTGNEDDYHYYKMTPSESGYYKLTVQDTNADMDQSIRLYRDETMINGTYCSDGTMIKLESGSTVYFAVNDNYASKHTYSIKLTKQEVPTSIDVSLDDTIVSDTAQISMYSFLNNSLRVNGLNFSERNYTKNTDGSLTLSSNLGIEVTYTPVITEYAEGNKYLQPGAYDLQISYLGSDSVTKTLKVQTIAQAAIVIGTENSTIDFTKQQQCNYFSFTPEESGYYILNQSVSAATGSDEDWYRNENLALYNSDMSMLNSYNKSFYSSKNDKPMYIYLEGEKTYYLSVNSSGSTSGSLSLSFEYQKVIKSISVSQDGLTGVTGMSLKQLARQLEVNVVYSDGSLDVLNMKNIVNTGHMEDDSSYVTSDTGVTVHADSRLDDELSTGTYTFTVTCQDVSCTVEAQIVSPADVAVEIADNTMNVTSTGDSNDWQYYKLTPSKSGYYKVDILDEAFNGSIQMYRDSTMTNGTECYSGSMLKLEEGKTVYLNVSDYFTAGTQYTVTFTKLEAPTDITVSLQDTMVVNSTKISPYQFLDEYLSVNDIDFYEDSIIWNSDGTLTLYSYQGIEVTYTPVAVEDEEGEKYLQSGTYDLQISYLGSTPVTKKLTLQTIAQAATAMGEAGSTIDFTKQSQTDYFSFTPTESGYYRLSKSVTAGTGSEECWERYAYLTLYNSQVSSLGSERDTFYTNTSEKTFCKYLESGKTYYLKVTSSDSTGGSMALSFEKQKTVQSITPTLETLSGVAGTNLRNLVRNLQWTITYSDGSPAEILDMKNIVDYGTTYESDGKEYSYVTSSSGVTVKMLGDEEDEDDGLLAGDYTLTATYQEASGTVTAHIVSPADVAKEITDTMDIVSTGNYYDYHYYKLTPSTSGYYKLAIKNNKSWNLGMLRYSDSAMMYGTSCYNNEVISLTAGNTIYFRVSDEYSSGEEYEIQLTKVEAPISIQVVNIPEIGTQGIDAFASKISDGLKLRASYTGGSTQDYTITYVDAEWSEEGHACTLSCNDGIELSLRTSASYKLEAGTYQVTASMLGVSTTYTYQVKTMVEMASPYTCGTNADYLFGSSENDSWLKLLSVTPTRTDIYTLTYSGSNSDSSSSSYYSCWMTDNSGNYVQSYATGAKISLQAGTTYYFVLRTNIKPTSMNFCLEGSKSLFDTVTVSTLPTDTAYSVLDTEYKLGGLGLTCNYAGVTGKTFAITSDMLTGITSSNHTVEVQDTEGNKIPVTIAFKKVSAADFTGAIHPVAGSNALVITVDGIQKEVPITVAESPLTDMKLASANPTYEYGNTTNMLSDVSLQMNYNGTNKTVTIADLQKNIANSSYDAGYGAYPIQLQVPDDINSAGDKVFTVSYMGKEATLTVTVKKQTVSAITITDIDAPVLDGTPDKAATVPEDAGYSVLGIQWKDDDGKVVADGSKFDGAKRYTAYVTVKANDSDHKFTTSTNATVNGCNVLSKTSNQNGTYTLAYRFGYTDCKVTLPQSTTGITNVSGNTSVTYKGDYTFTVTIDPSYSIAGATVKANDQILKASSVNTNTYTYTLTKVFQNQNITIKDLKENTEGINVRFYSDENKTTLADQYAVNIGSSVSANAEPDDKVPNLGTYTDADGKEMMFYGWYRDLADASTRIKSNTTITLNMATTTDGKNYLDLLPKYIQQTFRYEYNGLYVVYKIISISESGKVKLQLYNTNMKEVSATVAAKAASHIPGMCIKAAGTGDTLTLQSFQYDGLGAGETVDCDITEVSANAFAGASTIRAISLPNTVETIEAGAFAGCTSLESVVIPQSVTSLEENTFNGCTNLTDVVLPDSLETIDSSAFAGTNSGLTITCSSSVKALASSAAAGAEFQNVDIAFTDYDYSTMDLQYTDSQSVTTAIQVNGSSISSTDWSSVTANSSDPDTVKVVKSSSGIAITACGVSEDAVTVTVAYKGVTKTLDITTAKKSITPPSYMTSFIYTGTEQDCVLGDEDAYTMTGNRATNAGSYTATIIPAENYQWEDGTTTTRTITWSITKAQLPANAYKVPTGLTAKPGQKLGDISLPAGFKWDNEQEGVGTTGTHTFTATYTGANTNYNPVTGIAITVSVASPIISVTGVTLNQSSMEIAKGKTAVLAATVAPSNATNQNLTWSSSNTSVATVAADGTVTAKANGSAVITVATADGNKTAACTVNVVTPAAKVITTASASIVKGKTLSLSATMTPSDTTDKITWSSSNPKVATVSTSGKVTAKGIGSATITATATSGKKATCKITVVKNKVAATSIKLNKSKSTIKAGETLALTAKLSPNKTTDTVTWSSSSKKIATVDKNGIVTGIKGGTVTITGKTTNGLKATCTVTVKVPAESVSINKTAATIKVKKTIKLKATMNPKGSTDSLTWSSSNKKCATVSKDGTVKGLKKGTVTITVKTSSGKKATCKITIK